MVGGHGDSSLVVASRSRESLQPAKAKPSCPDYTLPKSKAPQNNGISEIVQFEHQAVCQRRSLHFHAMVLEHPEALIVHNRTSYNLRQEEQNKGDDTANTHQECHKTRTSLLLPS